MTWKPSRKIIASMTSLDENRVWAPMVVLFIVTLTSILAIYLPMDYSETIFASVYSGISKAPRNPKSLVECLIRIFIWVLVVLISNQEAGGLVIGASYSLRRSLLIVFGMHVNERESKCLTFLAVSKYSVIGNRPSWIIRRQQYSGNPKVKTGHTWSPFFRPLEPYCKLARTRLVQVNFFPSPSGAA